MPEGTQERVDLNVHREVLLGAASDPMIPYRVIEAGKEVDPTGGTAAITVYKPDAATKLVDAAAMTISGKLLNYNFNTSGGSWTLGENYVAELALTVGGKTYQRRFIFDVVKTRLEMLISGDHFPPEYKPAIGESDFSRILQQSFAELNRAVRRRAHQDAENNPKRVRPALILDSENFSDAHLSLAAAMVCREAMRDPQDRWGFLYEKHIADYEKQLQEALDSMIYDEDEDAAADALESEIGKPALMRR
jgi:hypothetical protein